MHPDGGGTPCTPDLSVTYTLVNEGSQSTDLGDYFAYNAGLAYALTPDAPEE